MYAYNVLSLKDPSTVSRHHCYRPLMGPTASSAVDLHSRPSSQVT